MNFELKPTDILIKVKPKDFGLIRAINLGSRGPVIRQLLNLIQKTCFLLVKENVSLVLVIFFLFTVKFHTLFQCLYLNYCHHSAKNCI